MAKFQAGQSGNPRGRPTKVVQSAKAVVNGDGWQNVFTGLASAQDPTSKTTYRLDSLLSQTVLDGIFYGDGIGRKIVEMLPEDATRRWLTVSGDLGPEVLDAMETLNAQSAVADCAVFSRLYGGAAIFRLLNDGGEADQPLNYANLQNVIGYRVYDRFQMQWTTSDLDADPLSSNFGKPRVYNISPTGLSPFRVHHSRLCIMDGKRLPSRQRQLNQGWGASELQGLFSQLVRVGETQGYTANIIRDFIQSVLSVKGLSDMLASGQDELVKDRVKLLDLSRSILNMMILDADGETYSKTASSVAGLADLLDRFSEMLSAVSGYPMTKLFGRSPAGMSATGESDMRNYYDSAESYQKLELSPIVEVLIRDIYNSQTFLSKGKEPEAWSIKWNSLWQPTETETATMRKTVADMDAIYLDRGVVTPEEVAKSRFGEGEWSLETVVDLSGFSENVIDDIENEV